jgi:hypothetical protein
MRWYWLEEALLKVRFIKIRNNMNENLIKPINENTAENFNTIYYFFIK